MAAAGELAALPADVAAEGLVVEKAADVIKNPLVLEFLGLEERHEYSESELEAAIIDKLEHFLLELGKGFLFEARKNAHPQKGIALAGVVLRFARVEGQGSVMSGGLNTTMRSTR